MSFKYKFGDEITETPKVRTFVLPEGVSVQREPSSESGAEKKEEKRNYKAILAENLKASLAVGGKNEAAIKKEVEGMS